MRPSLKFSRARRSPLATVTGNEQSAVRRLAQARSALQAEQAKLEADERMFQMADGAGNVQVASATSAGPDPSATSLAINGPQGFAVALLQALGDPVTSQNTLAIEAWYQREGGAWNSPARYNPLNTSMRMPGSHAISRCGGDGAGPGGVREHHGIVDDVTRLHGPVVAQIALVHLPRGLRPLLGEQVGGSLDVAR